MTDYARVLIARDAPIVQAIQLIEAASTQIALVVDADQRLLGTITDGDVRRGILRGVPLDAAVERIMKREPVTVGPEVGRDELLGLMSGLQVSQIPRIDSDGRVIGLEILGDILRQAELDNWVVLMAGGLGVRLRPLTEETPKPLLSVGGRPVLETILDAFVGQGFHRFYISVNYKAEMFKTHFGDGSHRGIEIRYLDENRRLGTAGALSLLPQRPESSIIVMNGDLLTSVNFRQLLDFHESHAAKATMCVREYSFQVPYGVVRTEQHRLLDIEEKPVHHFFVSGGIYALHPDALDHVPAGRPFDMPALFKRLIGESQVVSAFPVHEYWLDIGHVDDLKRAESEYLSVFGA